MSSRAPFRVALGLIALVGLWWLLAMGARTYADGDGWGWQWVEGYARTGKWGVLAGGFLFVLGAAVHQAKEHQVRQLGIVLMELVVVTALVWRTIPIYAWMSPEDQRDERGHLRQSTHHSCGPVALGNLMEVWGVSAPSERELVRRAGTTTEGTTISGMIRAAEASGFTVRSCESRTVSELLNMTLPVIVRVSTLPGLLHATTLTHFKDGRAYFIDPDYGRRSIPIERFERVLTGKVLELVPRG